MSIYIGGGIGGYYRGVYVGVCGFTGYSYSKPYPLNSKQKAVTTRLVTCRYSSAGAKVRVSAAAVVESAAFCARRGAQLMFRACSYFLRLL